MATSRIVLLLLGDSITQQSFSTTHSGWGASLADWYCRFGDVFNRGYSGYNSRWLLQMLRSSGTRSILDNDMGGSILDHRGVAADRYLITLFLGANDASDDNEGVFGEGKAGQGVPIDEYAANINEIIDTIASRIGKPPQILLITPARVNGELWRTRSDARMALYADKVREIGKARDLPVVDLWEESGAGSVTADDTHDGLHFNTSGNNKVFQKIQSCIRDVYPTLAPDDNDQGLPNVPMHFPYWAGLANLPDAAGSRELIEKWDWPQSN